MSRSGANYRMSRANKVMLASYVDRHRRGEIKRTVISADMSAQQFTARSRDKKQPNNS